MAETPETVICPLCRGEEIQPYETMHEKDSDGYGLSSYVTWRMEGTTLYQKVAANYLSNHEAHYGDDGHQLYYCIPVYHLSHCPYCRRRLVKSLRDNDMKIKSTKVSYYMLCSPRLDGDGNELAIKLKEGLTKALAELATLMEVSSGETVKLVSCQYLSDGEIKVHIKVSDNLAVYLTKYLYTKQDELGIDILEAGKD